MAVILLIALCPGSAGVFCSLVLIVSIGALEKGPMAPEIRPMQDVCQPGKSVVFWYFCRYDLSSEYAVKLAAWFVPWRNAVSETPRHNAPAPSSFTTVYSACAAFRYFGTSSGSAIEWCCACRRILTTSMGVTTRTASVTPAARPAR